MTAIGSPRGRGTNGTLGDVLEGRIPDGREVCDAKIEALTAIRKKTYVPPTKETGPDAPSREVAPPGQGPTLQLKASYRQIVRTHLVPRIGARRLDDLDAADLNRLYGDLASFGRKDGSGLSDKTVRNVHIVIRKALGDALRWGQLACATSPTLADPPESLPGSIEMKSWSRERTCSLPRRCR